MRDPRYSKFYKLRKRDPDQLTADEARYVRKICIRMMDFVRDGATRKQWEDLAELYGGEEARPRATDRAMTPRAQTSQRGCDPRG